MNDSEALAMVRWAESVVVHHRAHVDMVRAQMIAGSMVVLCSIAVVLLAAVGDWMSGLPWLLVMAVSVGMTVVSSRSLRRSDHDLDDIVCALGQAAAERGCDSREAIAQAAAS
jgi:hypothetical protein